MIFVQKSLENFLLTVDKIAFFDSEENLIFDFAKFAKAISLDEISLVNSALQVISEKPLDSIESKDPEKAARALLENACKAPLFIATPKLRQNAKEREISRKFSILPDALNLDHAIMVVNASLVMAWSERM